MMSLSMQSLLLEALKAAVLVQGAWWLGLSAFFLLVALDLDEDRETAKVVLSALSLLALLPTGAALLIPTLADLARVGDRITPLWGVVQLSWAAAFVGVMASWWWLRKGVAALDALEKRLTRRTRLERDRRTDVRRIHEILPPEIGAFDPLRYIKPKKGLFVGLDEHRRPVYIPEDVWKTSHALLSGRTRSGKGVAAQILLTQAIQREEFVVVLDPKADAWMPYIFAQAAQRAGQPYVFLDLRPEAPPQVNLFEGCDQETLETMLVAAFSLSEKGDAADFYRLGDRRAARETAQFVAGNPGATPAEVLAALGEGWQGTADGFAAALSEMAQLPAVNAPRGTGLDINAMAETGGCLYVVGDMMNTRVIRMQRMLLVRLMMYAKKRDYISAEPRTITVFADEFKVHISRPFMTSLGASAGWGLHAILAFQSLQDLADVPADLDKDAVRGAVMENCGVQLSYRIKDPDTAEWLSRSTGTILVDDEVRRVEKNLALTETVKGERTISQAERAFIDTNMFMNLPKGCGVLVGATPLPTFCYTSPVKVERHRSAITPKPAIPPGPASAPASVMPSLPMDGVDSANANAESPPVSLVTERGEGEKPKPSAQIAQTQIEEREDFL